MADDCLWTHTAIRDSLSPFHLRSNETLTVEQQFYYCRPKIPLGLEHVLDRHDRRSRKDHWKIPPVPAKAGMADGPHLDGNCDEPLLHWGEQNELLDHLRRNWLRGRSLLLLRHRPTGDGELRECDFRDFRAVAVSIAPSSPCFAFLSKVSYSGERISLNKKKSAIISTKLGS